MPDISQEFIISADSHVLEDPHLWSDRLPARFRDDAPVFPEREVGAPFQGHKGGWDPSVRVQEMSIDGVSQEILYPSWAMNLFGLSDPQLQEACFKVYNEWLIEYCSVASDRLFGIAMLSTYDIRQAIAELERSKEVGFAGAMVWEVPPPQMTFGSTHYDDLWEVAEALGIPISLHILTGEPYTWPKPPTSGRRSLAASARHANKLVYEASNAVADLITGGVFDRFPQLKFVLVESEASWIPFMLSRYDGYASRTTAGSSLAMAPSEYFKRNFSATFFNDRTLAAVLNIWGTENCMWSNDFPHPNSTWPNSHDIIQRDLGHLPLADRRRLVRENVASLYNLPKFVPDLGRQQATA